MQFGEEFVWRGELKLKVSLDLTRLFCHSRKGKKKCWNINGLKVKWPLPEIWAAVITQLEEALPD